MVQSLNRQGQGARPTTTELTTRSENSINWNEQSPRVRAWKDGLTQALLYLQRDVLTGYTLLATIHAFDAVNDDIPTEHLPAVIKRSLKLKDEKGQPVYWDGRAVGLAYSKLLEENEGRLDKLDKSRLLAENAAAACQRCFGKEPHVRSCDHVPLTDEEREEQARLNAAEAKKLREQMKHVGSPKPLTREAPPDPPGFWLVCDSCGHRYNFMQRQEGDTCRYLLNRYLSEGGNDKATEMCQGTMRAV